MDLSALKELARYQSWADAQHTTAIHANPILSEDEEIRERLKHMLTAAKALQLLARGEAVDPARLKAAETGELGSAIAEANSSLEAALDTIDLERIVDMPRGPRGPFQVPARVVLYQAVLHGQHHRGQNASRMRALGITPPMTDYVIWYALGMP